MKAELEAYMKTHNLATVKELLLHAIDTKEVKTEPISPYDEESVCWNCKKFTDCEQGQSRPREGCPNFSPNITCHYATYLPKGKVFCASQYVKFLPRDRIIPLAVCSDHEKRQHAVRNNKTKQELNLEIIPKDDTPLAKDKDELKYNLTHPTTPQYTLEQLREIAKKKPSEMTDREYTAYSKWLNSRGEITNIRQPFNDKNARPQAGGI